MKRKDPNVYPRGLKAGKVRRIIDHYNGQGPEDAAREIESAPPVEPVTWVQVPDALLPRVRKLLAAHRKSA